MDGFPVSQSFPLVELPAIHIRQPARKDKEEAHEEIPHDDDDRKGKVHREAYQSQRAPLCRCVEEEVCAYICVYV